MLIIPFNCQILLILSYITIINFLYQSFNRQLKTDHCKIISKLLSNDIASGRENLVFFNLFKFGLTE